MQLHPQHARRRALRHANAHGLRQSDGDSKRNAIGHTRRNTKPDSNAQSQHAFSVSRCFAVTQRFTYAIGKPVPKRYAHGDSKPESNCFTKPQLASIEFPSRFLSFRLRLLQCRSQLAAIAHQQGNKNNRFKSR